MIPIPTPKINILAGVTLTHFTLQASSATARGEYFLQFKKAVTHRARLNHADVTVRLPHAVSNGKCGVRSGLLDQKEISRFIANSPELAGIRACILSLQAGDRILRASSAPLSLPCKPRRGSMTTRAPAAVARSTVRSLEAPSTTMSSATPCATTEATTAPIASSSPGQGMTAETMSVTPGMIALIRP
jgi:hypothetical protein